MAVRVGAVRLRTADHNYYFDGRAYDDDLDDGGTDIYYDRSSDDYFHCTYCDDDNIDCRAVHIDVPPWNATDECRQALGIDDDYDAEA